jgi:ABC-type branched-subunit amino acid transport system substrate-binding protein
MIQLLFALIVTAALSLSPAAQAAGDTIVIHHIGPLTGVLADSNREALAGANLFLDGFNARGGLAGRRVMLTPLDDAQDAKRSAEIFQQLVADRKLLALMMPRTTPSMEAMMPGVKLYGIPVVGPQIGASFINQPPKRELFTLRASYQKEVEVAIRLQHSIGVRRFALLLADDAFGRDVMVAVDRVFKELQIEPVASAKIDNRKPDVTEAVSAVLAKQPQVVMLVVSGKAGSEFVKRYHQQGGRATFMALSNSSNSDFLKGLADRAQGVIVMQIMPSPFAATTALAREFAAAAAKAKTAVSYAGLYGYASAKLLTLGLARAGREPTPASLVQALESLGEVDLGGFILRYGPGDRSGSGFVDSTIITADGRFRR